MTSDTLIEIKSLARAMSLSGHQRGFERRDSRFRALPRFRRIAISQEGRRGLQARDRRNDGAALRSPALGHQRRGIAGASTPRIAGASAKTRVFAGRVTIAARGSRRELRPDADPWGRGVYHWAGAAPLAYRRRPPQQLRQLGEVHRQPPRLAGQPIWSPSGATQRYVRNREKWNVRPALETALMTPNRPSSVGSYLGPSLASCFLISGLSYKTTFNSELRISSFPLYSI